MVGRFDRMAVEGHLPEAYWDPVTRWKFDSLLGMFRRNLALDNELSAIHNHGHGPGQAQEARTMEGGATTAVALTGGGWSASAAGTAAAGPK